MNLSQWKKLDCIHKDVCFHNGIKCEGFVCMDIQPERTCEGCVHDLPNGMSKDLCLMCVRNAPDLYKTKPASDTSDQARTCRIIEDPYRPIFKCCSSCYMHMEGNESECPSCKAKVVE